MISVVYTYYVRRLSVFLYVIECTFASSLDIMCITIPPAYFIRFRIHTEHPKKYGQYNKSFASVNHQCDTRLLAINYYHQNNIKMFVVNFDINKIYTFGH